MRWWRGEGGGRGVNTRDDGGGAVAQEEQRRLRSAVKRERSRRRRMEVGFMAVGTAKSRAGYVKAGLGVAMIIWLALVQSAERESDRGAILRTAPDMVVAVVRYS